MGASFSFLEDPADTREAIMKATYLALCEHGYAGLTIARIAEDFEKSKSLLYHHYESKDELLLDFVSFMIEGFERSVPAPETDAAADRLQRVFEHALGAMAADDSRDFLQALVELRAQAAHDARFREQFTDNDQLVHDRFVEIIESGIESGEFRAVDSDRVASLLLATLSGGINQQATSDIDQTEAIREELDRYMTEVLKAE